MFDEKTKRALRYYVYMLVDPRNNTPFYIGKGRNNRVFDHMRQAIKDENRESLKFDMIRAILKKGKDPEHIIIRHGLSEEEAYHVECALIDYANYTGGKLTVLASGHHSADQGLMTDAEIAVLYQARTLKKIPNDCVILKINNSYTPHSNAKEIYQATHESWRMADPRKRITTVLSMYHGLIIEVFTVESWYEAERKYGPGGDRAGETYMGWGFVGHVAAKDIRDRYMHKAVKLPKGATNSVIYNISD